MRNLIITPDNIAVFERSLEMLDTSIKQLRRVAGNLMPMTLLQFGLDEAAREYCNTIAATKMFRLQYQSFGMNERLDGKTETIIYRMIRELVDNLLKHSAATNALVQVTRRSDRLTLIVEDNGSGFDASMLETMRGGGWTDIYSGIDYLRGTLDIHSEKDKGTTVTIECNV